MVMKNFDAYLNYFFGQKEGFRHELSVLAVAKNEAPYIKEWLEFHKLAGVEKFYIYDNESEDNLKEVLQPYIDKGEVEYTFFPGKAVQMKAYDHAVKRFRNETRWLAVIDIDEFIVPVSAEGITGVIKQIEQEYGKFVSLAITCLAYGHNGHYHKPDGLIVKNFTKRQEEETIRNIKSIVNPRSVLCFPDSHHAIHLFSQNRINENGKKVPKYSYEFISQSSLAKIRINHYFTKSYEEYKQKIERGSARLGCKRLKHQPFDPDYLSQIEDMVMDKYIPVLEKM
jgi:vacuolar-type H+-ATPase subunit F/Vma7